MIELPKTPTWREDEISHKEFYKLPKNEKEEYLDLLVGLKPEERSSGDIMLLNLFRRKSSQQNKFLEL